jgi:hypothetical protein
MGDRSYQAEWGGGGGTRKMEGRLINFLWEGFFIWATIGNNRAFEVQSLNTKSEHH